MGTQFPAGFGDNVPTSLFDVVADLGVVATVFVGASERGILPIALNE